MRIFYILLSLSLVGCASVDYSIKINHDESIDINKAKDIVLTYFLNQPTYRFSNRLIVDLTEYDLSDEQIAECKSRAIKYKMPVKACDARFMILHKKSDPHCTPNYIDVLEVCNEEACEYEYIQGTVVCE